jgi:hypothetical protein
VTFNLPSLRRYLCSHDIFVVFSRGVVFIQKGDTSLVSLVQLCIVGTAVTYGAAVKALRTCSVADPESLYRILNPNFSIPDPGSSRL